ncbi:unnamed protein product, partial [marine sediment metagenome]
SWYVQAADLDGDGDLDLATANANSDNVSVLLGRGDGTFEDQTTYAAGDGSRSVYAADLDGDGDLDLVTVNRNSDNVSVLLNRPREADIALAADTISFGATKLGATDTLTFTIYNHGVDSTLQITGITSSNNVFNADTSLSVLPDDSATVTVTFTPTDMVTYSDSLTISSNDPQNPEIKVYITGIGNPIISTYPAQNALNVPLVTTIAVTFWVDISPATINAKTFIVRGNYTGDYNGTYSYNSNTKTATFNPSDDFLAGEVA